MIVITSLNTTPRKVEPGDRFRLCVRDQTNCEIVIDEEITVARTIDFIASFRFALEDGTCSGFHLTGIFANRATLPIELQNARMFTELPPEQRERFIASCGTKVSA